MIVDVSISGGNHNDHVVRTAETLLDHFGALHQWIVLRRPPSRLVVEFELQRRVDTQREANCTNCEKQGRVAENESADFSQPFLLSRSAIFHPPASLCPYRSALR